MHAPTPSTPAAPPQPPADIFQQAFNHSPVMQSVVRLSDGQIIEVNDTFLTKLGFTRAQVIGKSPLELGFWLDPQAPHAYREELQRTGFVRGREVRLRGPNGERLTVLLSSQIVVIGGEAYSFTGGVDITERERVQAELNLAHERLRQSEERFSKAFHVNPAMVAITRVEDGRFVSINKAFLSAMGYTEAEVIGRTSKDIALHVTPGQREKFLREVDEKGSMLEMEVVVRTKSGALRTLLASGERTEIDGVPHQLTVALDITERIEAEKKLRESELRLRESEARFGTAFRACPVIMSVARLPEAHYIEVNDAFLDYYGCSREEALGRSSKDLGLWVDDEARVKFFADLQKTGSLRNVECALRSRDGRRYTMLLSADIIEINREPHLLAFALDITKRKEAEVELQRTLEKERELSQLKTDFVALVSHEFRTPLEIIMSSVDNLDRYHDRLPADKRQHLLRTINKSVRRMSGMMEEVLVLGRFDAGGTDFRPSAIDLESLCQRVRDEMESATNRRCPIAVAVDKNVPGARGDEAVLRHILTNLLSNAVKYSAPGQAVKLAIERDGESAEIRIVDHGCGIPAADQPRLFQAFHRGSNAQQVHGTGLGLLIVRRCVELHGGEIRFESTEGRGSTFIVRLPLFAGVPAGARPKPAAKKKTRPTPRKK